MDPPTCSKNRIGAKPMGYFRIKFNRFNPKTPNDRELKMRIYDDKTPN
jgi:hypothetical protein